METMKEKIRIELLAAQERGHKIIIQKLWLVTALLGLGVGGLSLLFNNETSSIEFYQILYLTPVVAIMYDLLEMEQKYSVRRMGAFLRCHSDDSLEKKWEEFVRNNRDNFFCYGSFGFTVLTFILSATLLFAKQKELTSFGILTETIWFAGLFVLYLLIRKESSKEFDRLENIEETNTLKAQSQKASA